MSVKTLALLFMDREENVAIESGDVLLTNYNELNELGSEARIHIRNMKLNGYDRYVTLTFYEWKTRDVCDILANIDNGKYEIACID